MITVTGNYTYPDHTPEGLHRAIKHRAVEEGVTMVDMLRKLLEEQYGAGN